VLGGLISNTASIARMGLSIAYHAKIGAFDPPKELPEHREFFGKIVGIDKDNVEEFYKSHYEGEPTFDWNDL
jgi:ribose transport system substrate-binding protein